MNYIVFECDKPDALRKFGIIRLINDYFVCIDVVECIYQFLDGKWRLIAFVGSNKQYDTAIVNGFYEL